MARAHSPMVMVGTAAMAVAYKARIGSVDQMDVDAMVTQAQQLLDPDNGLCRACVRFAVHYETEWRDPEKVKRLGEELQHDLELYLRPDPPGMERVDIHG